MHTQPVPVPHTQRGETGGSLTLNGQDDRRGCGVTLDVAGLAGVAARVASGHFLHHQTSIGEQDAVLPLLPHFHALWRTERTRNYNTKLQYTLRSPTGKDDRKRLQDYDTLSNDTINLNRCAAQSYHFYVIWQKYVCPLQSHQMI